MNTGLRKLTDRKKEVIVACTMFLILFLPFFIRYDDIQGGLRGSDQFIEVPGIILSSKSNFSTSGSRRGSGYKLAILYQYKFNGKVYESNKYSFGQSFFSSKNEVESITSVYKKGQKVTVYVSNENPNTAVLKPEINSNKDFTFLLLLFALIGIVIYLDIKKRWIREDKKQIERSVRKKRKKRR